MISNATELNNHLDARNLLVAVKNELLQNICHSLNTLQMTTLAYLISKIKPGDSSLTVYEIDLDELLALLRWTDMRYASVRTAINALSKAEWWIAGSKTSYHGFISYSEISYSISFAK